MQASHTKPELRLHEILRALDHTNFVTPPISTLKLPCREWAIIVDVLFIREKVVMEVAGEYWHKPSKNKSRKRRMMKDEARTQCLINNGYTVIEFTDVQVNLAYDFFMKKKFIKKERAEKARAAYANIKYVVDCALKGK